MLLSRRLLQDGARDWLKDARDGSCPGIFEVRFKNTRKGFYVNDSAQNIRIGDLVVVEAVTGLDLGIVTLEALRWAVR